MTKVAALAVVGTLGFLAVAHPPLTRADDPAPPATVTVTQTRTVEARVQGLDVHQWRYRAVANRRVRNRQRRELAGLRHAARARAASGLVGLIGAFECIHFNPTVGHGEGPWGANTGNGYHGGLQMDWTFMRTYGGWAVARWGPAENWPPDVQLLVAMTAWWSGRGFGPWPETSKACGL